MRLYRDKLLRSLVVVEIEGGLWLVPRSIDGWQRRQRLAMTDQARAERLQPESRIDAAALGIPPAIAATAAGDNGPGQVTKEATPSV